MANGRGGTREGAGRPKGSTRRVRFVLKSLAGEEAMFDLLDEAMDCLRRQMHLGDTSAAQTVVRFCLVPPEKRAGLMNDLERERLSDDVDDGEGAEDEG